MSSPTNQTQIEAIMQSFWQELDKLTGRAPFLMARSHQLLESFAQAYQTLCQWPRPLRRRWQRRLGTSLAGVALALALGNAPVSAATITVSTNVPDINSDAQCSLFEAIINANNNAATYADCGVGSGADIITLSGNTYTLTTAHDIGIGLPVISSTITIAGNGAILARDGNADPFSILVVDPDGVLTLNDTTITGGAATVGGGIYNAGGAVTLHHSTVSDNFAYLYGGGILNAHGVVTLMDSTVSGNITLVKDGGGIFNVGVDRVARASQRVGQPPFIRRAEHQPFTRLRGDRTRATVTGDLLLINSTVTGNVAGLSGGGIFNLGGDLTLTSSHVTTNTAQCCGGGIYTYEGVATLSGSTVISNTAGYDGGGIASFDSMVALTASTVSGNQAGGDGGGIDSDGGTVTVTKSTISANQAAADGGGMDPDKSRVTLVDSTIDGNAAGYAGGALLLDGGAITLTNSTISGNMANMSGGGLFITGTNAVMTVTNSTISGNTANTSGGGLVNTTGATVNLRHTLISGNTAQVSGNEIYNKAGATINVNQGNLFGHSDEHTAQALDGLAAGSSDLTATDDGTRPTTLANILNTTLADNGGATQTHALVAGSPAIDAAGTTGPTADQRGVARPQGAAFDIGAFEVKVINSSVTQLSVSAGVYNSTAVACGASSLPSQVVTPTLHNNTATIFTGLFFKVKTLEYKVAQTDNVQPKLCNADTPGSGLGATLTVASALPGNGNLTQGFQIGLPVRAAYRFFVDLYSSTTPPLQAGAIDEGEYLGSFVYEFDENGQLISRQNTLFLPVVVR